LQTLGLVPVAITVAACAGVETKSGAITAKLRTKTKIETLAVNRFFTFVF
jgi:hypothetical protein